MIIKKFIRFVENEPLLVKLGLFHNRGRGNIFISTPFTHDILKKIAYRQIKNYRNRVAGMSPEFHRKVAVVGEDDNENKPLVGTTFPTTYSFKNHPKKRVIQHKTPVDSFQCSLQIAGLMEDGGLNWVLAKDYGVGGLIWWVWDRNFKGFGRIFRERG